MQLGIGFAAEPPIDVACGSFAVADRNRNGALARVIADATVHCRERIVSYQSLPCSTELALLCQGEPGLDVFSCRARVVARRQQIHVHRPPSAEGPGTFLARQIDRGCDIGSFVWHIIASMQQNASLNDSA